jgi:ATP-dependent exoDNAse (exonuclease V) beta subunit
MKKMATKDEFGSALTANNAITLMTVHKSKGLEFPLVAVVETGSDWFKVDQYWLKTDTRESGIAYVGTKNSQPIDDQNFAGVLATQRNQLRAEAQRLLYVALTRASHYLVITGNKPGTRGKESFFPRLWKSLESIPESHFSDGCLSAGTAHEFICTPEEEKKVPLQFADFSTLAATKSPIPIEIELVQPSKHLDDVSGKDGLERLPTERDPHHLAPLLGNVIHRCFEQMFRKGTPDYQSVWHAEFLSKLPTDVAASLNLNDLFTKTQDEFRNCTKSASWNHLLKNVHRCTPEMEIVQLLQKQLIRGSIDLLIEYADGNIRILDYKTAHYSAPVNSKNVDRQEDLQRFCRERGYDRQLGIYARGVRSLYPDARIDFGVWLTKERAWVPLGEI